jgi:hypothetical protein
VCQLVLQRNTFLVAVGNEAPNPPAVPDHYATADAAVLSPHFYYIVQSLIEIEMIH